MTPLQQKIYATPALLAARKNHDAVTMDDFEDASGIEVKIQRLRRPPAAFLLEPFILLFIKRILIYLDNLPGNSTQCH